MSSLVSQYVNLNGDNATVYKISICISGTKLDLHPWDHIVIFVCKVYNWNASCIFETQSKFLKQLVIAFSETSTWYCLYFIEFFLMKLHCIFVKLKILYWIEPYLYNYSGPLILINSCRKCTLFLGRFQYPQQLYSCDNHNTVRHLSHHHHSTNGVENDVASDVYIDMDTDAQLIYSFCIFDIIYT